MIAAPTPAEHVVAVARFSAVGDALREHPGQHGPAARLVCSWQPDEPSGCAPIHNARVLRLLGHVVQAGAAIAARLLRQRHPDVDRDALVRCWDGRAPHTLPHVGGVQGAALDAVIAAVADDPRALHAAIGAALREGHGIGGLVAMVIELGLMVTREADEQAAELTPFATPRHADTDGANRRGPRKMSG